MHRQGESFEISLHPSGRLRWGIAALHALACISLAVLPGPTFSQFTGVALILLSACRYFRRPRCVTRLRIGKGAIAMVAKVGAGETATRWRAPLVSRAMIVLVLTTERERVMLICLSDSMTADDFRRLQRWLRWNSQLNGVA